MPALRVRSAALSVGHGPVHQVQVDVIGAEPAQAVLDGLDDPAARAAAPVASAHVEAELRRQHDLVAVDAGEGLAEQLLGLAA
jgi:hypothetical protein